LGGIAPEFPPGYEPVHAPVVMFWDSSSQPFLVMYPFGNVLSTKYP